MASTTKAETTMASTTKAGTTMASTTKAEITMASAMGAFDDNQIAQSGIRILVVLSNFVLETYGYDKENNQEGYKYAA
ncbi:hypothetical protein BGZ90_009094, partial [Linnemannia elongata]